MHLFRIQKKSRTLPTFIPPVQWTFLMITRTSRARALASPARHDFPSGYTRPSRYPHVCTRKGATDGSRHSEYKNEVAPPPSANAVPPPPPRRRSRAADRPRPAPLTRRRRRIRSVSFPGRRTSPGTPRPSSERTRRAGPAREAGSAPSPRNPWVGPLRGERREIARDEREGRLGLGDHGGFAHRRRRRAERL